MTSTIQCPGCEEYLDSSITNPGEVSCPKCNFAFELTESNGTASTKSIRKRIVLWSLIVGGTILFVALIFFLFTQGKSLSVVTLPENFLAPTELNEHEKNQVADSSFSADWIFVAERASEKSITEFFSETLQSRGWHKHHNYAYGIKREMLTLNITPLAPGKFKVHIQIIDPARFEFESKGWTPSISFIGK